MQVQNEWGEMRWKGRRLRVTLRRHLEHPVWKVWGMLTDSACLPLWLAPGQMEPRFGGRVQIAFANSGTPIDSVLTAYDPGRELAYSWSNGDGSLRPLCWTLTALPEGCTDLRLELNLPEGDRLATSCAGWDAHLEMLVAALEGIAIHFPRSRFREARVAFAGMASLLGACEVA
ncbi:MAG: SRPBCC domain-containing protein [Marinobacter sp.]|uniref:SRPBCC domain-containing protein n=1 Tax=Marinobacter sp. TaxID=50741 RepID=UPI00299D1296|nr:SRPBCC domain-containing protein [Marinobacter sp.]MDX1755456.1 SRPBCC domain-containing protein [Marinobacter sp.]